MRMSRDENLNAVLWCSNNHAGLEPSWNRAIQHAAAVVSRTSCLLHRLLVQFHPATTSPKIMRRAQTPRLSFAVASVPHHTEHAPEHSDTRTSPNTDLGRQHRSPGLANAAAAVAEGSRSPHCRAGLECAGKTGFSEKEPRHSHACLHKNRIRK